MSDRNINDLTPSMQVKHGQWEEGMDADGIDYLITATLRTQIEQQALWNQGRTTPGPIVTWTLHSKHLTGEAFDFVIMWNGKPDWTMAHRDLWDKSIEIGKSLGLTQVVNKEGKVLEFAHLQEA